MKNTHKLVLATLSLSLLSPALAGGAGAPKKPVVVAPVVTTTTTVVSTPAVTQVSAPAIIVPITPIEMPSTATTTTTTVVETTPATTTTVDTTTTDTAATTDATATDTTVVDTTAVDTTDTTDTTAVDTTDTTVVDTTTTDATATVADNTIYSVIENDNRLGTLRSLLSDAGLEEDLSTGNYTIFAPTDDAFAAFNQDQLAQIASDPALLKKVLNYHLVKSVISADSIKKSQNVDTAEGQTLGVVSDGNVTELGLNKVKIIDGAVASNGAVYVIDGVLVPSDIKLP